MKSKFSVAHYVLCHALFLVVSFSLVVASCSFLAGAGNDSALVTIELASPAGSRRITDEEKSAAKFNVYVNGNLAAAGITDRLALEAKVGEVLTIRIDALVAGSRVASGEKTITAARGNNIVDITLLEDRAEPAQEEEPAEWEEPVPAEEDRDDVIFIYTAEELRQYAEQMCSASGTVTYPNGTSVDARAASYRLGADLDLAGLSDLKLSTEGVEFSGDFDGNGHKIKNFASTARALFHDVSAAGIIRNLILENVSINAIFGQLSPFALALKGKLIGCQVSGTVGGSTQNYGLAEGYTGTKTVVVGCLSEIDPATVNGGLCGSNTETHGAAFATDSADAASLNAQIAAWNEAQAEERLRCDWHFETSGAKLTLVRGAP